MDVLPRYIIDRAKTWVADITTYQSQHCTRSSIWTTRRLQKLCQVDESADGASPRVGRRCAALQASNAMPSTDHGSQQPIMVIILERSPALTARGGWGWL